MKPTWGPEWQLVIDHVAAQCPALPRDHVADFVRQAAGSTVSLRRLAAHITDHPDALTSGSSDAPPPLVRLAGLLVGAGVGGIRRPCCLRCGLPRPLPTIVESGRVCNTCHRREMIEVCCRCGRTSRMAMRAADGPLCLPCYRKDPAKRYPCAQCGRRRPVSRRLDDGSGLCEGCAPRLHRTCTSCGQPGVTATLAGGKVICRRCYRRPERECSVCGRHRPAKVTEGSDGLALCSRCYRTPVSICLRCSSIGPCDHDTAPAIDTAGQMTPAGHRRLISQPIRRCDSCGRDRAAEAHWPRGWICRTCYVSIINDPGPCPTCGERYPLLGRRDGELVCGPCVGDPRVYTCPGCQQSSHPFAHGGYCVRCALRQRLTMVIVDGNGVASQHLRPLIDTLADAQQPRTVWNWLFAGRHHAADAIAGLAGRPGPLSHEILDELPAGHRRNFLRRRLVEAGVLPARDNNLELLASWVDQRLADLPEAHARIVRPYATWTILRRTRQRADRTPVSEATAGWARMRVNVAVALLAWLDEHALTLGTVDQNTIDRWVTTGSSTRYEARHFLCWATERRLVSNVEIPVRPKSTGYRAIEADERWHMLNRLWHDNTIALDIRVGGSLVLLFGQHLSRIVRLTTDRIAGNDHSVTLILDRTPVSLPEPLAALVVELRDQRLAARPSANPAAPCLLFPGRPASHPISTEPFRKRLALHGIQARLARNAALTEFAADLPAPVLAELLGLHIGTAVTWTKTLKRDWSAYLEARATVSNATDLTTE
jgi:hypothetical protein